MFKRKFRLPAKTRLTSFISLSTLLFNVKFAKNGLDYNRYGFIVSKQVDKRAVIRNTLRRKIRSCIEEKSTNISQGFDFLFIVKRQAALAKQDICAMVFGFLEKEHLLSQ